MRDGPPLPPAGERPPRIENAVPCERGYHGSGRAIDALRYSPGSYVARVRLTGFVLSHGRPIDKWCAQYGRGLTDYFDATDALYAFARHAASTVLHLWGAPEVVREWLSTGRDELRSAAYSAAYSAADSAAYSALNERLEEMLAEVLQ